MNPAVRNRIILFRHLLVLGLLFGFAVWLRHSTVLSSWQAAGQMNFVLGFVLLAAFSAGQVVCIIGMPKISGYIFAGIFAGPYVSGLLTTETVTDLRLIDDLALSFIALSAGGALKLDSLGQVRHIIVSNIVFQLLIAFGAVFLFLVVFQNLFDFTRSLPGRYIFVFALLIGVIAVARSPSSAMAIITECRAKGPFTETALGVTVAMDVLIIILFTIATSVGRMILAQSGLAASPVFAALFLEIALSLVIGALLGWCISVYISHDGPDLTLFLVFIAFGITKIAFWLKGAMLSAFAFHIHLEPLLICMAAGFVVRNYKDSGDFFEESLERVSLPIYVFFFSVAGAALNLHALRICWPIAISIVGVRMAAIFAATWLAGSITRVPKVQARTAWMAYITQAGVAIGLGQLAERQFPELAGYLTTVVLAMITINQIIGPVTFKLALQWVGEARSR